MEIHISILYLQSPRYTCIGNTKASRIKKVRSVSGYNGRSRCRWQGHLPRGELATLCAADDAWIRNILCLTLTSNCKSFPRQARICHVRLSIPSLSLLLQIPTMLLLLVLALVRHTPHCRKGAECWALHFHF